jgi:Mg/Co/Ni transporter MgtE
MQPDERLAQRFAERHPEAAAAVLAGLPPRQLAQALAGLEISAAVALVPKLPVLAVARCLEYLGAQQAAALLAGIPLRNAAEILRRLTDAVRDRCLAALPQRVAAALRSAIEHAQDSVAAFMDGQVRSFAPDDTVERVLAHLEQERESGCHIYMTDAHGRFAGVLSLRDLIASHPHARLGSFPVQPMATLPEGARSSSVLGHPAWLRHTQLPVIDSGGRFVGVLWRERLSERNAGDGSRQAPGGALGMGLALMEGYAAANAVLLEVLMRGGGGGRRR